MLEFELLNIEELIKRRIKIGPVYETNYLSSVLKRKKLDLNMTLEDFTNGICSLALGSRILRNLTDWRNKVVPLLCERVDVDYESLSKLESNNRIEKALYAFMNMDYNQVLETEEVTYEGVYIAEDELIKAFKFLIKREYKKLNNVITKLDTVKDCLSDIELFSLLLIVFEYNFYILRCNKAMEYIKLLEMFYLKNDKCILFIKERKFILSCIMEHNDVKYLFEELKRDFHLYTIDKQIGFYIYYNQTLDTQEAYDYLLDMGKNYIPEKYNEEYNYSKALVLSKMGNHLEAMKLIIESGYARAKFVSLFAYNLFLYSLSSPSESEYKSYKGKLYSLMKIGTMNSGDTYHVAFLKLMQLELENVPLEEICNNIKNNLIKELFDYCYPLYDDYIKDRYCLLLGKLCRYKDAYMFLLQTKILLKK